MKSLRFKGYVVGSKHHKRPNQTHLPAKTLKTEKSRQVPSRHRSKKAETASPVTKTKLFVGGIPSTFTKEDLIEYFETYGEVFGIRLKTKKKNVNVNLGFGTITVAKSTADKILATNFYYIQGRKVECQRFVKKKKSQSKLIKDKKVRTLYIIEPPESMDENNLKKFFEKFGKIENCYILPERRVPLPPRPDDLHSGHPRPKRRKFDFLKRKALILFEAIEAAMAAYQKSQQGKVVFEGNIIKLAYKYPEKVKEILNERKKDFKEETVQQPAEGGDDLKVKKEGLRRRGKGEDHLEEQFKGEKRHQNAEDQNEKLFSDLEVRAKKVPKSVKNNKNLSVSEQSGGEDESNSSAGASRTRPSDVQATMTPIPVLNKKEHQKTRFRDRGRANKSQVKKQKNSKNRKNSKNLKNSKKILQNIKLAHSELAQKKLLQNLPNHLKRSRDNIRPTYMSYMGGFWGKIIQKLEERRRSLKPGQTQYRHTDHEPFHSGMNIRINIKNSALRQSNFSLKAIRNGACIHTISLLHTPQFRFEKSNSPCFTLGSPGNHFGF